LKKKVIKQLIKFNAISLLERLTLNASCKRVAVKTQTIGVAKLFPKDNGFTSSMV
jgi:hypothetical protein